MTYPFLGDNAPKGALRPRTLAGVEASEEKRKLEMEGRTAHQVVGAVRADQADDG